MGNLKKLDDNLIERTESSTEPQTESVGMVGQSKPPQALETLDILFKENGLPEYKNELFEFKKISFYSKKRSAINFDHQIKYKFFAFEDPEKFIFFKNCMFQNYIYVWNWQPPIMQYVTQDGTQSETAIEQSLFQNDR